MYSRRTTRPAEIEALTQQIGREMLDRAEAARPGLWQRAYWQERLLNLFMGDESFRIQAFRFIDALPTLSTDAALVQHLREYFGELELEAGERGDGEPASGAQVRGLLQVFCRLMRFRSHRTPLARIMALAARKSAAVMAGSFIAGSNVLEAVNAITRMRSQGLAFTIDVLGEAALSRREADHYLAVYDELLDQLPRYAVNWPAAPLVDQADGRPLPRVNVSVKITSLNPSFDPLAADLSKDKTKSLLRPLLRKAMQHGIHVHVDMEHYAIKELTLELVRDLFMEGEFRDYPHFGVVLQAYLKEGEQDAAEMIDWAKRRGTPFWIRLVKGAYWDSETVWAGQRGWPVPVWEQKWQSDACFERMTRMFLANHEHIYTALGSHNIRSLSHGLACKRLMGVPGYAFEWQMLYGMGDEIKAAAVEIGQRSRIYTPYGDMLPGMAYLIRRLLENTANESFLRKTGSAAASAAELLADPAKIGRAAAPAAALSFPRNEFEDVLMDPFVNVPDSDFSQPADRQAMLDGLSKMRAAAGRELPLIIRGARVTSGRWCESLNPSRPREVVARVAVANAEQLESAVRAAKEAFADWRRTNPRRRAEIVRRAAGRMQERRFELAALICLACGKPWREADADVSEAIDYCNYYAREIVRISENIRRRDIPGETNTYRYEPRGVCAVIAPWNFPLAIPAGMVAGALVTGNTVVFKPANVAAAVAYELTTIFEEAGLPTGVLNFLPGPGAELGEALVRHPGVALINFSGSREVGLRIHQLAATTLTEDPAMKCVIAEMGGKNAIIVDDDADMDDVIKGILASAFAHAGQKCTAASRLIALDGVHDRLLERLVDAAGSMGIGPADEPGTSIPPVIDRAAYDHVLSYIELGKREARCVLEPAISGENKESGGYYIGPTIFADVSPFSRIARDEIFGPVLCVLRARDIDHAIELFNNSDYALTGGIYSRSPANIRRAREACECGNFYINRRITGSRVDLQPFGGLKLSGNGARAGGPDYLLQFCTARTVTENTLRRGFAPSEEVVEALT